VTHTKRGIVQQATGRSRAGSEREATIQLLSAGSEELTSRPGLATVHVEQAFRPAAGSTVEISQRPLWRYGMPESTTASPIMYTIASSIALGKLRVNIVSNRLRHCTLWLRSRGFVGCHGLGTFLRGSGAWAHMSSVNLVSLSRMFLLELAACWSVW
jgi:hypothetical protein